MRRRIEIFLFFLILLISAFLRLYKLGELNLVGDEASSFLAAKQILLHGYPLMPSGLIFDHAPTHVYLEALSVWILGPNEFGARFSGGVAGIATVILGYLIARNLFGRVDLALMVMAILAVHPWMIEIARFARGYSLLQFLYLLCVWWLYQGYIQNKLRYQLAFIPVYFLALLTQITALFVAFSFLTLPFFSKSMKELFQRRRTLAIAVCAALSVLAVELPTTFLNGISVRRPPAVGAIRGVTNAYKLFTFPPDGTFVLKLASIVPILLIVVFVGFAYSAFKIICSENHENVQGRDDKGIWFFFFTLILSVSLFTVFNYKYNSRYISQMFPVLIICFVWAFFLLQKWVNQVTNQKLSLFILVLSLIFLGSSSLHLDQLVGILQRQDGDKLPSYDILGQEVDMPFNPITTVNFLPDTRSISNYVNRFINVGDQTVVLGAPKDFMLNDMVNARVWEPVTGTGDATFSLDGDIVDIFTKTPVISSLQDLCDLGKQSTYTWLVFAYNRLHPTQALIPPSIIKWIAQQNNNFRYVGKDGISEVYLFEKKDFENFCPNWTAGRDFGSIRFFSQNFLLDWKNGKTKEAWYLKNVKDTQKQGNLVERISINPDVAEIRLKALDALSPTKGLFSIAANPYSNLHVRYRLENVIQGNLNLEITAKPQGEGDPVVLFSQNVTETEWNTADISISQLMYQNDDFQVIVADPKSTGNWLHLDLQLTR